MVPGGVSGLTYGNCPPPPNSPVGTLFFDTGRYAMMAFTGTQWVEVESRPQAIDEENFPYKVEGPTVVVGDNWQYATHDSEVWLLLHGYVQQVDWVSAPVYTGIQLNRYRITFGFRDETVALHFKILWGGESVQA